jgi:hypothetical protein
MAEADPHQNKPSLDLVFGEMRHREQVQDAQFDTLTGKASYLLTAGLGSIGATGAYIGFLSGDREFLFWPYVWPVTISFLAFAALLISFVVAYRVRDFQRAPEAAALLALVTEPADETKDVIADGRRFAIQTNELMLTKQATWINRELIAFIALIFGLACVIITATFS